MLRKILVKTQLKIPQIRSVIQISNTPPDLVLMYKNSKHPINANSKRKVILDSRKFSIYGIVDPKIEGCKSIVLYQLFIQMSNCNFTIRLCHHIYSVVVLLYIASIVTF